MRDNVTLQLLDEIDMKYSRIVCQIIIIIIMLQR